MNESIETPANARPPFQACLAYTEGNHACFLLEGTEDAVFILRFGEDGRPGRILHANDTACRKLGYTLDEFRGFTPADINLPEFAERIPHLGEACFARGTVRFETTHVAKNGALHPVKIGARLTEVGGRLAMVAVVRDVSDIRTAEAEVLLFKRTIETCPDTVIWTDPDGRFAYVNEATCRNLGYTRDELMRRTVFDISPGAARPGRWQELWRILRTGMKYTFRAAQRRKDGTEFPVEITSTRVLFEGRELANSFVRDLTETLKSEREQQRIEALLAQARKMESIGRLAGGIAHDFNNALGVILGTTDLALGGGDATPALRDDLRQIREAASYAADLARSLLAFAREQPAAPGALRLAGHVGIALPLLRKMAGPRIRLSFEPAPDLWDVFMDPVQLEQILTNLCVNARDALGGQGMITLTAANVTFAPGVDALEAQVEPGDFVRLAVRDEGCGMDTETMRHLFEPFFTTKPAGKGTGLGLSIVHGIVKQNGGGIRVRSAPGQGATFELLLPRHREEAAAVRAKPVSNCEERRERFVLLVEDDASMLRVCARKLEHLGHRILPARTAGEALRLAAACEGPIDLLLTDLGLPDMNGRELALRMRARFPGIGIILTSGSPPDELAIAAELGSDFRILPKPFSLDSLLETFRATLDRRPPGPTEVGSAPPLPRIRHRIRFGFLNRNYGESRAPRTTTGSACQLFFPPSSTEVDDFSFYFSVFFRFPV